MSRVDTPVQTTAKGRRPPWWKLIVSAVMIVYLGAQFFAGWKFLNSETYPIVGSAMFAAPPIRDSNDFLVPRVFGQTTSGERVEMDQHTFSLEAFEWRRWIKRHLEDVTQDEADAAFADLAAAYTMETGTPIATLELWRIPSLTDDFERGRFIRSVEL